MSITWKRAQLFVPKGDKPREYLEIWRPISLLNVTYEIGSSYTANRLKTVLPNLISDEETGFVAGKYIGDNLHLLYDIIYRLKTKSTRTTCFGTRWKNKRVFQLTGRTCIKSSKHIVSEETYVGGYHPFIQTFVHQ